MPNTHVCVMLTSDSQAKYQGKTENPDNPPICDPDGKGTSCNPYIVNQLIDRSKDRQIDG